MTSTRPAPQSAKRWLQLLAACMTGLLIPLCFTGPAVVLPAISQSLGGSPVELAWILNAYILSYGGAMMVSGSLTDIYGRRRIWIAGLASFCVITFALPFAPSVLWMDVLRLLQGLGGAAAFAAAMSSLAPLFDGTSRARVFSLLGTTFGLGLAFGPLISGWVVDLSSWQMVFHSTGLVGVISLLLVLFSTPQDTSSPSSRMDWPGAISFTAALALFTYGMLLAPEQGWGHWSVLASLAAALLLLLLFVWIEKSTPKPMLDLSFFRSRRFVGVQLLAASPAFLFIVLIVLLPGRLIGIDGYSALAAGQMMVWLAAPLLFVPFAAALLTRHVTAGHLSAAGLLVVATGLLWLAAAVGQPSSHLGAPMLLIGIGIGLPWGVMDGLAVSVVEPERVGMATGIFNTVRVAADGVAIAVVGALLATLMQQDLLAQLGNMAASADVLDAANRAAHGQLTEAVAILPGQHDLLVQVYDDAFVHVLYGLAVLAVATAAAVFYLLGRMPESCANAKAITSH